LPLLNKKQNKAMQQINYAIQVAGSCEFASILLSV